MRECKHCGAPVPVQPGAPVCAACHSRNKPRYSSRYRECPACGKRRRVPDEIRPTGKSCLDCQRRAKAARTRKRYRTDPEYRERRAKLRRERRLKAKAEGAAWIERERKYQREYRTKRGKKNKQRAYHRAWRQRVYADAERYAEYRRRQRENAKRRRDARPELREHEAAVQRAYYERIRSDPKRWEDHLADQRMRYRMRQAANGTPPRPLSEQAYANGNGKPGYRGRSRVPAAPLLPLIAEWLPGSHELHDTGNGRVTAAGLSELAKIAHLSVRRLYAITHEEIANVERDTADRICAALSVPFTLVYPEHR